MKKILFLTTITLLTICSCSHKDIPSIRKINIYVQQVNRNSTTCEYQKILLGIKSDSVCFFTDASQCYIKRKLIVIDQNQQVALYDNIFGIPYSIRYTREANGFIMWITNMNHDFPHYVISTSNICITSNVTARGELEKKLLTSK